MTIARHDFRTVPLSGEAYEFITEFFDTENRSHSEITVVFNRSRDFREGTIVDIYSQNGKCDETDPLELLGNGPSHLFSQHDIRGLNRVASLLTTLDPNDRTVLVLDLKDSNGSYINPAQIVNAEKVVCEYIGNPDPARDLGKRAKRAHEIFHSTVRVDHVLKEGSLKNTLLQFLSEDQAQYFLCRGAEGHSAFCELTEPFINALKLGHSIPRVQDSTSFFSPMKREKPFHPGTVSIVHYPEQYNDLYSPHSPIPRALRNSFPNFNMAVNELTRTTSMTIDENNT